MKRSFDTIAAPYAFLERLTFGRQLQVTRSYVLNQLQRPVHRALLLGDGNGSFAIELLQRHPDCRIDSLDISPKMLAISQRRIRQSVPHAAAANWHPILADAKSHTLDGTDYDFIGLHFFLDCFKESDCQRIVRHMTAALQTDGILSFADFSIPQKQPHRSLAYIVVRSLYLGFNLMAGLKTKRLPSVDWPPALQLTHADQRLGGLLSNQVFVKG